MSLKKSIICLVLCFALVLSFAPCALLSNAVQLSNEYRLSISDSYILGVPTNTTVAQLMASVHSSATIKNTEGTLLPNTDTSCVCTGFSLCYPTVEYYLVVVGDITADGIIKTNDYTALKMNLKGRQLTGAAASAADIDMNGIISTSDCIVLTKHIKNFYNIEDYFILTDEEKANIVPSAPVVGNFANSGTIHFDGSSVTVSGTGVSIVDNYAYITESGEYTVTGTGTNAYIRVNAATEEKVKLILSGVSISTSEGPAIFFEQCKKAYVVLADGTTNTLSDGTTTSLLDKGALFSNDSLEISGLGALNVTGNRQHGIASDDDIVIESGTVVVASAVTDALHANDDITVKSGTVTVQSAGSDALESEGTINISGGYLNLSSPSGNALKAITYSGTGGSINITSSNNGVKGDGAVNISGGDYVINSSNNCIKGDIAIDISGGTFKINSTKDGIKAYSIDSATPIETRASFSYTSLNGSVTTSGCYVWTTGTISNTATYWQVVVAESNGAGGYTATQILPHGTAKTVSVPTGGILVMAHADNTSYASCCLIQKGDTITYNTSTGTVTATTSTNYLGDLTITGGNFHITSGNDAMQAGETLYINNTDTKRVTSSGIASTGSYNFYIVSGGGATASVDTTLGSYKAIKAYDAITIDNGAFYASTLEDTISSDDLLTINGSTMTITSGRDGIAASNMLTINGGSLNITTKGGYTTSLSSSDTNSYKGLKGTAALYITGGTFVINCPDDAVHSNGTCTVSGGTFTIYTGDDAFHSDTTMNISGGNITVMASYEGIEGKNVNITGGTTIITASDDGVNAAGGTDGSGMGGPRPGAPGSSTTSGNYSLTVSGANTFLWMNTTGDGLDSNGSLTINGGTVIVQQTGGGNSGFDADGTRAVNGGLLIVVDGGDMIELPTASTQPVISYKMSSSISANTLLNVQNASGTTIFTFKPTISYKHMTISSPSFSVGSSYKIYTGGSTTGTSYHGLYTGGTYTAGTLKKTATLSSTVTSIS